MNKTKLIVALLMIGILGWFIDVFGRTMTPFHRGPRHVQVTPISRTWDGHIKTKRPGDPFAEISLL